MQYTGMAALQFASIIVRNSAWVAPLYHTLLASCAALWLTFRLRHEGTDVALRRAGGAAVLLGIAIAGYALRRHEGRTLSLKTGRWSIAASIATGWLFCQLSRADYPRYYSAGFFYLTLRLQARTAITCLSLAQRTVNRAVGAA